jgi:hypothetical protein
VVPTSQLREAYAKIRELERALGRKTMEVEILRAAQEIVKKCMVRARRATASILMEGTVCANVSGLAVER